jgi:hypothetical protein
MGQKKTDRHDITDILLKMALNTITLRAILYICEHVKEVIKAIHMNSQLHTFAIKNI